MVRQLLEVAKCFILVTGIAALGAAVNVEAKGLRRHSHRLTSELQSSYLRSGDAQQMRLEGQGVGRALALSGNGFLAVAVYSALAAASDKPDLEASFAGISTVTSVSGGSWFLSELAYSGEFSRLVQNMAMNPGTAGEEFEKLWVAPFLAVVNKSGGSLAGSAAAWLGRYFPLATDFSLLLNPALQSNAAGGGVSWSRAVGTLLSATSDIRSFEDENPTLLSSPVQPWASGKRWLACTSILSRATVWDNTFHELKYASDPSGPLHYPAKFEVEMGSDGRTSELCASGVCDEIRINYSGTGSCDFLGLGCSTYHAKSGPNGSWQVDPGLPLSRVVAASSAFAGGVMASSIASDEGAIFGPAGAGVALSNSAAAPFGDAYDAVDAIANKGEVTPPLLDALASRDTKMLIDGAYTDNTGIAWAVASGNDDIIVWTQQTAPGQPTDIYNLFVGGATSSQTFGISQSYYNIFSSPSSGEVKATFEKSFTNFTLPSGTKYLTAMSYGSINAVTADSSAFGIRAGRGVVLRIISVTSSLNLGVDVSYSEYSQLVQEILDTVAQARAKGISFDPFFDLE